MGSGGSERTRPISRSVHEIMAHRFPFEDFEPKEEMKKSQSIDLFPFIWIWYIWTSAADVCVCVSTAFLLIVRMAVGRGAFVVLATRQNFPSSQSISVLY